MTRDCHAGICGSRRVRPPPATQHLVYVLRLNVHFSSDMASAWPIGHQMRIFAFTSTGVRRGPPLYVRSDGVRPQAGVASACFGLWPLCTTIRKDRVEFRALRSGARMNLLRCAIS